MCVGAGVVSADNEDETQRPEEASDGEVQGRGGSGLRRRGQVIQSHSSLHVWSGVMQKTV